MTSFLRRLILPTRVRPVVAHETILLRLPDGSEIPVQRIRHPQARRIKVSVSERGIRLTLPMRASLRAADAFLHEHRDWIADQLSRWNTSDNPAPFGLDTATLPLRGDTIPLTWSEGRFARAARDEHGVSLQLPSRAGIASAQRALRELYLTEARADVARWLPKYLDALPRPPTALRFRPLASLWGSLSAADALSLDLALVLGQPSAFEYVLVHELCHLLHRNHAQTFWRAVEARWPDWRAERDYLHGEGAALKSSLRRLIATA
jgi:predicted metal-dependent hydrolase